MSYSTKELLSHLPFDDPQKLRRFVRCGLLRRPELIPNPGGRGRIAMYSEVCLSRSKTAHRLLGTGITMSAALSYLDANYPYESIDYAPVPDSSVCLSDLSADAFVDSRGLIISAARYVLDALRFDSSVALSEASMAVFNKSVTESVICDAGRMMSEGHTPYLVLSDGDCRLVSGPMLVSMLPSLNSKGSCFAVIPLSSFLSSCSS